MLVFDVSGSMAATDVEPTRIEAAKKAAREFILSQPSTVQIGVVTFSGNGFTVQPPTNDPQPLLAAIERLRPQTSTSLGQGILVALNALAVDAGLTPTGAQPPAGQSADPAAGPLPPGGTPSADDRLPPGEEILAALPEGEYPPAVIVLLSDGENNAPPDPLRAAQAAAERGVRIDALGFGTATGTVLEVEGFRVHTILDEAALQQIVQLAGGAYYNAQTATDPQAVYANLTPRLVIKPEKMEITSVFSGAGLLAMLLGALFSLIWFNRLI
jgi:Ca-activated chloride channel family protein